MSNYFILILDTVNAQRTRNDNGEVDEVRDRDREREVDLLDEDANRKWNCAHQNP